MKIDVHTYTNMGSRDYNEDFCTVRRAGDRNIAVLCDGLGGCNCGEVASQTAATKIAEGIENVEKVDAENIYRVIYGVNLGLLKMQETTPQLKGMRTTAVGCVTSGNTMHYFNTGDSRFYYFSNGSIRYMTKDHSVSQMTVEMGEMTFDDIRSDPDRNKLIKVMGDNSSREAGTIYTPISCKRGDAFLLCSDGFWEYVLENEMEIDLSKSNTAKEWLDFMLVRLLLRRTDNNDNFTVVGGIIR